MVEWSPPNANFATGKGFISIVEYQLTINVVFEAISLNFDFLVIPYYLASTQKVCFHGGVQKSYFGYNR